DEDPQKELNYINILVQRRIDGMILAPSSNNTERLDLLSRYDMPCVLIDRHVKGKKMDIVRGDNAKGGFALTRHLIGLGHRDIAIMSGPVEVSTASQRLDGYRRALAAHDIPIQPDYIKYGTFKEGSSEQIVKELLAASPRPTAIVAMNNLMCIGALRALRAEGLRVPEDIALVSFDDIPQASSIYPFLTVCVQDAQKMGQMATALLMERIADKAASEPQEIVLDTTLIVRESCGAQLVKNAGIHR
ncbi:MAG TPA: substrate-binding domain-containing protein, partial [Thermoflexales bacterium]|nr:substrate-binding domain-containing protein [Thermoflexales bacterium]